MPNTSRPPYPRTLAEIDTNRGLIWKDYPPPSVFRVVKARWGVFSNFAKTPLNVNGVVFQTSEALYQTMRFTSHPDVQEKLAAARDGYAAKQLRTDFIRYTRLDWDTVKVSVMAWVLKVKAMQAEMFCRCLLDTDAWIIEESRNDIFWGAQARGGVWTGANVLGQLLVTTRYFLNQRRGVPHLAFAEAPAIPDFRLMGNMVPPIPMSMGPTSLLMRLSPDDDDDG